MATRLTNKQQAFINAYLTCFNGTQAAISAGYSKANAAAQASNLLKDPKISQEIRERVEAAAMTANEVLYHLAQIARGDVGDMLTPSGSIDLELAYEYKKTNLIKRINQRTITTEQSDIVEWEIEPYDRIKALELLGKNLGMFNTVKIEDWRTQAISDIRTGKLSYEALVNAFDAGLATELFAAAGVSISLGTSENAARDE